MTSTTSLPPRREEALAWNFPLGIDGFFFGDLYHDDRLKALDARFLAELRTADPGLADRLVALRATAGSGAEPLELSNTLMAAGPHVGRFVARLFRIEPECQALDRLACEDEAIFRTRRHLLERRYFRTIPTAEQMRLIDANAARQAWREVVSRRLGPESTRPAHDPELELGRTGARLLDAEAAAKTSDDPVARQTVQSDLDALGAWARVLAFHPDHRDSTKGWALFFRPEKLDYDNLVERQWDDSIAGLFRGFEETRRFRDGFDLTDRRMDRRQALGEMHYCVICHERGKDSCSHGFPEGPVPANKFEAAYRKNPLGIPLTGCPLDEKISEANGLKREGHSIAALAMVMVDNPLCAGTGHRICNDCMKGCIYQKTTPVNIPQAETNMLTDVLGLPHGFEIYSLLTRWNPLNPARPYPLPYNGKNVLIVGMGPAGYTLAQYLLNEGFGVVGLDGLKIEPMARRVSGPDMRVPQPVRDIRAITPPLHERTTLGFGGVSEYGITVRWDKNFLDVIYHLLTRREHFRLYDGVRFGSTITIDQAWDLGFDHIALATGAGRPTLLSVKNNLVRGVRAASDFLMGLQGTGIARHRSLGNLQVELPALVVGGGLTAIDTGTELQAYYIVQVEKTLERYEILAAERGEDEILARFDAEEREQLGRWLVHGRAARAERRQATAERRAPDFSRLVESWGGVHIVYRKRLLDSPAYRLNHEEVIKCLEEGVSIIECQNPVELISSDTGALAAVVFERQELAEGKWRNTGELKTLPARTLYVAAGTHPNAIYEREHPGTFAMDRWGEFYRGHRLEPAATAGSGGAPGWSLHPVGEKDGVGFFTSYEKNGRFISFYGDNHPVYAGNVVKAMASARDGFREVVKLFAHETAALDPADQLDREFGWSRLVEHLDDQLLAEVVEVIRLTPNIVEVVLRAPQQARNFHPGQFYRMQNYETTAEIVDGYPLAMEGVALTGAWVDRERGLLSTILLEMGGSSNVCALLKPGERVVLMGPTGAPTHIPEGETVLLAGGGLGNAVLFSIAEALKRKGNRVLYFAGYKRPEDLYKRSEIESHCDIVIWATDVGPAIEPRRPQDRSFVGNIVQAIDGYAKGELGPVDIPISQVNRLITIGSDRMMAAVKTARRTVLACHLPEQHVAIGSINSPMQCMMKEICAQCLQRHIDPASGKEEFIFSCFNQDQELDRVDFGHLASRLRQNSAQEKLTIQWIDRLMRIRAGATAGHAGAARS